MREILLDRNNTLIGELNNLLQLVNQAVIPVELQPYKRLMVQYCQSTQSLAQKNLDLLNLLDRVDISTDILSETQQLTQLSRTLSALLIPPILRAADADRLSLAIIAWLHKVHPKTAQLPPVIDNREWSVLPFMNAPIYCLPCSDQRGLLYQPLSFHEFGHVLYKLYRPELDELVLDLQREIIDQLEPASQRNDPYARSQSEQHQVIANTWYNWIQEFYCDTVGLMIGGPSFVFAWSSALNTLQLGDYYAREAELRDSTHPVKWLRLQFLIRRAEAMGLSDMFDDVANRWGTIADALAVQEDYHGFYDSVLDDIVVKTIDDMITETAPRQFSMDEISKESWTPKSDTPISLLNLAWNKYTVDPADYAGWEQAHIDLFVNSSNQ